MTPNDAQIDILLRQFAQRAKPDLVAEHLDADELNAFAEGTLPTATRSRYVSHLSDCNDCRKIATQLISASGSAATIGVAQPRETETISWREKLNSFFAPQRLRYAAFAVVLVAAAGVTFLALRRQPGQLSVARTAAPAQTEVAVKQDQVPTSEGDKSSAAIAKGSPSVSQPRQTSSSDLKTEESKVAENAPAPKPLNELPSKPAVAANQTADLPKTQALPSFAPPPPGEAERAETRSRAQQNVGGIVSPRKDESPTNKFKAMEQARAEDVPRNRRVEENKTAADNQSAVGGRRDVDKKAAASRRELDRVTATARNTNESQIATLSKHPSAATGGADAEEAPETRAGGRKFRRQGNAWVDTKFKSSMSVKNISRGSDEYGALDARIRAIAEQLGGEVIVVWKGKAYRIH